jgi:MarR family transcriptional regulator, organic hydroperoxide resistance regulator
LETSIYLMKPEDTIDFHIRWAWHSISRLYNNEASRHGLSMSTGYVLLNIDQKEGTPSTKLGPLMGMEPRSLVRTLKAMEEEKLITRKTDKNDKRVVRIYLTEKGRKKREISRDKVIKLNEYIQQKIPDTRLRSFFQTIDQIKDIVDSNEIF